MKMRKGLALILALAMVFTSFSTVNVKAEDAVKAEVTDYKIYPTPHEETYDGGEFEITNDVNVVYGNALDVYTKAHVEDVLKILDKTPTVSDEIAEGKTNLIVGVKGQEDAVNTYFAENALSEDDAFFEKYDAYVLSVKDNVIAVLGKDTDAAFHGVTTLKHVFNQVQNDTIKTMTIKDWADVKARGFIEGYYGNPWSNDDRADLMTFGGDYKLNSYFYAPKDDPKHNSQWRELYTAEELEEIKKLAEAGNKSKCYYVYALHTFMHNPIRFDTEANYQEDLNVIKTKFEQMMGAGVKQFAILADDANVPTQGASTYVKLMTDLTNWMKEKQATVPGLKSDLVFCPNDYMGWGTSSQMQTLKNLPSSVSIIQTGGRVWGEVGPNFNNSFYNSMGRPAYMWINWPCTDNTKWGLIMGGAEAFLKPGVNPATVDGIVLNPMQQSEPSKEALFTNADYAWNIWENASEYDQVWNDSFNFMDHGTVDETVASASLREISKHMKNSYQVGNGESEEIKDKMSQFVTDYKAKRDITAQADELLAIFTNLQECAAAYKANPGNPRTRDQIIYWLDCWQDTTEAIINYLNAAKLIREGGSNDDIWNYYSNGQAAFDSSKTHGFHYVDHTEYAKAGSQYITPFMEQLNTTLANDVMAIVNPSQQVYTYISNRTDITGDPQYVLDGDPSTEVYYNQPNYWRNGDYVGVSFKNPMDVNSLVFRLGNATGTWKDTMGSGKVQYTTDEQNWTDVPGASVNEPIEVTFKNLGLKNVKAVRLIGTAASPQNWVRIRDIVINSIEPDGSAEDTDRGTVTLDKVANTNYGNGIAAINDNNESTYAHLREAANFTGTYQDYIPVDGAVVLTFANPKQLGVVNFVQDNGTDKLDKYAIEYSEDGTSWNNLATYTDGTAKVTLDVTSRNITAKAIRVRNLEQKIQSQPNDEGIYKGWWWKVFELSATKPIAGAGRDTENVYTNTTNALSSEHTEALTKLLAEEAMTLQPNEYVGVDLGRIKDLAEINLGSTNYSGLTLQISKNGMDWEEADLEALADGRYVRLVNLTEAPVSLTLDRFEVSSNEITGPYFVSSTLGDSWETADLNRNNGAAFDRNMDTKTKFGGPEPVEGDEILYCLGQERTIDKITFYCQDSDVDYIRDGEILVSNDNETWTKVVTIGDGVENTDDFNTNCVNSGIYKTSSTYPNKMYVEGTADHVKARYLKIVLTAPNLRGILFNEIVINDGEYTSPVNDPTFETSGIEAAGFIPQNMFDGDLATAYRPASAKAGYLKYTLSEALTVDKFNIMQIGKASNAKVLAYVEGEDGKEWVEIGALTKSLNEFYLTPWQYVYALKFEWEENSIPTISEIIGLEGNEFLPAKAVYSAVDAAIAKADVLVEAQYTEATWKALEDAVNAVERDLPKEQQETVDGYAAAIRAALKDLQLKTEEEAKHTYTVIADGKVVKEDCAYNDRVTIEAAEAPEGKVFAGWEVDGKIVSLDKKYTFYVSDNIEFTSTFADDPEAVEEKPEAMMTSASASKRTDGKSDIRYVGQLAIPEGYTLVNAGLVWSTKDDAQLVLGGALKPTYITAISNTNQFSVTIKGLPENLFLRGRIFATLRDKNGKEVIVYSAEKKVLPVK